MLLTRVLYRVDLKEIPGGLEMARESYEALGPPNRGEKATFWVFPIVT